MLDELQKAKLVEWAEWGAEHGFAPDRMPEGIFEIHSWVDISMWAAEAGFAPPPIPTFDRDEPYTFGEDHA